MNCKVVDVREGRIRDEDNLRIEAGRVVELSSQPPNGAQESIDLEGRFLLPGLISCHEHLSPVYPFSAIDDRESPAITALRSFAAADQALRAGVTTVRCLGEQNRVDLWLRQADARGWIRVPRILAAGAAISTTGGHGDAGMGFALADGPDEFMRVAREEIGAGADHIKIFITGGIANAGESLTSVQMTEQEMRAVVIAAESHGKYVVAHCANSAAMMMALDAGVRGFEHGYELKEEAARELKRREAFLTPTLCCTQRPEWMREAGFEESQIDRVNEIAPLHMASIETAIRAGVTLVIGTDGGSGEPIDGTSMAVVEAELLAEAGLSPIEVLRAATVNAARLLRIEETVGLVDEGFEADLIALKGDPLMSVGALREMDFVMRRGEVVRADLRGLGAQH